VRTGGISPQSLVSVSNTPNINNLNSQSSACCILLRAHFIIMALTDLNRSRVIVIAHQIETDGHLRWNEMAVMPVNTPGIEILPMRQRLDIKDGKEDWTGKSSTAERRKLQNRLNQRALRLYIRTVCRHELIHIRTKKAPGERNSTHKMRSHHPTSGRARI
jgi:hypothetical protein